MRGEISAIFGGRKVELRQTVKAVTPFGGLGGVCGVFAEGGICRAGERQRCRLS